MAWSRDNQLTVMKICPAHRRTRQRPHRWQCICCAARRDVALTLVSGAYGVYGLGTVPSEPRQWLRGACGHIECTISRFVYLVELEVAKNRYRTGRETDPFLSFVLSARPRCEQI